MIYKVHNCKYFINNECMHIYTSIYNNYNSTLKLNKICLKKPVKSCEYNFVELLRAEFLSMIMNSLDSPFIVFVPRIVVKLHFPFVVSVVHFDYSSRVPEIEIVLLCHLSKLTTSSKSLSISHSVQ